MQLLLDLVIRAIAVVIGVAMLAYFTEFALWSLTLPL